MCVCARVCGLCTSIGHSVAVQLMLLLWWWLQLLLLLALGIIWQALEFRYIPMRIRNYIYTICTRTNSPLLVTSLKLVCRAFLHSLTCHSRIVPKTERERERECVWSFLFWNYYNRYKLCDSIINYRLLLGNENTSIDSFSWFSFSFSFRFHLLAGVLGSSQVLRAEMNSDKWKI